MKKLIYLIIGLLIAFPAYGQGIQLTRPSYHQGYAHRGDSAAPDQFRELIGCWNPSLGVTGEIIKDVSGYKNDGVFSADMDTNDWVISNNSKFGGYTIDYNDTVPRIVIGAKDIYNTLDNNNRSMSMWVNHRGTHPTGYGTILAKNTSSNAPFYFIIENDGTLNRWQHFTSSVTLSPNQWYHIVYTFTPTGADTGIETFYVNGDFAGTRTGSVGSWNDSSELMIAGNSSSMHHFRGMIGEVRIYRRTLTQNDAMDIYRNPTAMFRRKESFAFSVPEAAPSGTTSSIHWLQ